MGQPAVVMGDQIVGQCALHLIPNPATGVPQPGPPFPFSAPLTVGLCTTVLIGGQPAAVVGSNGYNTPPHIGLHPSDPFMVPTTQMGQVTVGSTSVLFGGQPAAYTGCTVLMCAGIPANVVGSGTTVLIG